jgi:hypothetical protein
MPQEPEQIVDRLHEALVEEIRSRRPQYLSEPFTVAEIYQDLVPYRSHRDQIGASMNGDYEHALLRLLAGWGGYVTLESEPARRRLAEELETSNPNTGIFREYAALDVRLNPALIPPQRAGAGDVAAAEPDRIPPEGLDAEAEAAPEAPARPSPPSRPHGDLLAADAVGGGGTAASMPARSTPSASRAAEAQESCRWCREALPRKASLRFCPFCGMDVNLVPCQSCGEELEPSWRFCIACGTHVETED